MVAKSYAIVNENLDTKYDANTDAKVEVNMGTIVHIKFGTNCDETNVDATTDVEMDSDLDPTRRQTWMKNKMKKWM